MDVLVRPTAVSHLGAASRALRKCAAANHEASSRGAGFQSSSCKQLISVKGLFYGSKGISSASQRGCYNCQSLQTWQKAGSPLSHKSHPRSIVCESQSVIPSSVPKPASKSGEAAMQIDYAALSAQLDDAAPLTIMDQALEMFGNDIAIAFSGAEDVALIEYAHMTGRPYRVFSLDTGRLNPETYRLFDEVEKRYGIRIEYTFPNADEVEELVRAKGMFSFYEDGHQECCRIRKVKPLRKQLKKLRAWITGQRKDQSPGTRAEVPIVQVDPAFEGLEGGPGSLIKWNPLSNQKSTDVWGFLRLMNVPVNALHAQGYISIGCEPCTRSVLPGQHEREGRWWWEEATAKECGLHKGNFPQAAANGEAGENGASSSPSVSVTDLFEEGGKIASLSRADMEALADSKQGRTESTLAVLYAPWCQFCQAMEPAYVELANELDGTSVKVSKFRADGDEKSFAQGTFGMKSFPTIVLFPKQSSSFVKYPSEQRDVNSLLAFIKSICGTQ